MSSLFSVDPKLRADRRRNAILEAARAQFLVEGFAAAGVEAIARSARVSTATLYDYFPSKTELFEHVVKDAAAEFAARFPRPERPASGGVEELRAFALSYARFMGDPFVRGMLRLVAAERRRFAPIARHFFERGRSEFGGRLIRILARVQDEGEAEFRKLSWAAGQLLGMIEHPIFMVPLVTGDEVTAARTPEEICDDAIETFLARYRPKERSRKQAFAYPAAGKVLAAEP